MKTRADAVKGWLRKAESDMTTLRLCLSSGEALDSACFHAQQAAEKVLKAYLTAFDLAFPFVHNLEQLVDICMERDATFSGIKEAAQSLTPYAVGLRYDDDFWPTKEAAEEAGRTAQQVKAFIVDRIPEAFRL